MRKVVYNDCYGEFSLSDEAIKLAISLGGNPDEWSTYNHLERHNPILVQVVEQLGEKANGSCADLKIATVEHKYRIEEYDGAESVMEPSDYHFIE